jgi:hypothetical protein
MYSTEKRKKAQIIEPLCLNSVTSPLMKNNNPTLEQITERETQENEQNDPIENLIENNKKRRQIHL